MATTNMSADELRQVQYALRTYGGTAGQRLADELGAGTAPTLPAGQGQQQQGVPEGGQQESQQEA